jgi:crotonobetainyl-CoA:carnitine CoA-transferase CaiB-like acyl-CoA transferase
MSQIPLATPLAGIKVLEFSHTVMGPTAGLVFAELGADVIKVEPAPKGDHTRGLGGFGAGFFAAFNRNKRSLAMDLKRKDGQAVIHRLIPTADLVLENLGPGTMEQRSRARRRVMDAPQEEGTWTCVQPP